MFCGGGLCCKSRRSRPMTIARRFIGGCQGRGFNESVKRTTDDKPNANELFRRPLHGLDHIRASKPSAKALGYFRSVRFADEDQLLLQQSRGGVVCQIGRASCRERV